MCLHRGGDKPLEVEVGCPSGLSTLPGPGPRARAGKAGPSSLAAGSVASSLPSQGPKEVCEQGRNWLPE